MYRQLHVAMGYKAHHRDELAAWQQRGRKLALLLTGWPQLDTVV